MISFLGMWGPIGEEVHSAEGGCGGQGCGITRRRGIRDNTVPIEGKVNFVTVVIISYLCRTYCLTDLIATKCP